MKNLIFTFLSMMVFSIAAHSQTTYYWVGGATGSFSATTSWNTQLDGGGTAIAAAPALTDILIFDGSNIGGVSPAIGQVTPVVTSSYTINQLKFQNAADVVFYRFSASGGASTGTSILTINGDGSSADDLLIDATSNVKLTAITYPTGQSFAIVTGAAATGTIGGTIRILDDAKGKDYIAASVASSIYFANGSKCYTNNSFAASYPLSPSGGSTINFGIIFQSGSSLIYQGGNSPYTTTSAAIPMTFATGSNFIFEAALAFSNIFTRHNLSNVTIRNNVTVTADGAPYNIDNLTIEAGSTFKLPASGGYPVAGNILNDGTFNIVAGTSNLVLVGTTLQTVGGLGIYSLGGFTIATGADVLLTSNVGIVGSATSTVTGKLNTQTFSLSGAGPFNLRTAATATSGGNLTTGAYTITLDPATYSSTVNTANVVVGALVTAPAGVPANTYITATNSATSTFTVNKPATLTTTGNASSITILNNAATLATSNAAGVDGSITTAGARTFGTGSHYIFNGPTSSPFSLSSNNTTGNVTFLAPVTTNKTQNIGGILNLVNGNLIIRNVDTLRLTNATDIAGAPFSSSKYIITQNASGTVGVLRMDGFSTTKLFPVGSSTNYLPASLIPSSSMDFVVSVFEGVTSDGTATGPALSSTQKDTLVNAVWTINRVAGAGDCTVQLNWPTSLEGSLFTNFNNAQIGVGRYNGINWDPFVGSGDNVLNTATASFTNFSPFVVGQAAAAVPVQFKNLRGTLKPSSVQISWDVLNEDNIFRYIVEKSTTGTGFGSIGSVNASNKSSYSYDDLNASQSVSYYRVKIISQDGSSKFSNIVLVKNEKNSSLSLYPNPAVQFVQISGLKANSNLKIMNASGQVFLQQQTNANSISLDIAVLKPGFYLIEILNAGNKETISFIKN